MTPTEFCYWLEGFLKGVGPIDHRGPKSEEALVLDEIKKKLDQLDTAATDNRGWTSNLPNWIVP